MEQRFTSFSNSQIFKFSNSNKTRPLGSFEEIQTGEHPGSRLTGFHFLKTTSKKENG
jgi:hypothetical protein